MPNKTFHTDSLKLAGGLTVALFRSVIVSTNQWLTPNSSR